MTDAVIYFTFAKNKNNTKNKDKNFIKLLTLDVIITHHQS